MSAGGGILIYLALDEAALFGSTLASPGAFILAGWAMNAGRSLKVRRIS